MSTEDIKTKYGIDTTDFKTGISQMNRALRVLNSDFSANAASMGNWEKSASGLEARNESLGKQLEVQQLKVAALKSEYERLSSEQGANSAAAQNALIAYNKGQQALNTMQAEVEDNTSSLAAMSSESDQAGTAVSEMGDKTESAGNQMITFGQVVDGVKAGLDVAVKTIAAVGAALVGVGAAIGGVVLKASEFADGLVEMSDQTGISTTRLQELSFVGSQIGVDVETISKSMAKLTKTMGDAQGGSQAAKDAFKTLGVAITDNNGNLLGTEEVFASAIDALGKVENQAERDALAMDIFGKSALELNPLIKTGSEEIANLSEQAHEMGAVVSEDNVQALGDFSDSLAGMQLGLQGTMATIASAVLPGFQDLANTGSGYLQQLAEAVTSADGDVGKMGQNVANIVLQIVQDISAQLPMLLQTGLQILMTLLEGIMAMLPTLLPVAIEVIQSLITFIVQALPMLLQAGIQILLALINGIVPMLPMLLETAVQIIVMLLLGITAAIPQLIPVITDIIPRIILVLIENLPLLIGAALQLITALAVGLVEAIPVLVPQIPVILTALVNAIVEALPMIIEAGRRILLAIVTAISDNLPWMTEKAKEIVTWVLNGLANMAGEINKAGTQIVNGVWAGIQAQAAKFRADVLSFFTGIVDAIKRTLGIKSPSTVFAGIGENMALGLGKGFEGAFGDIERNMRGAVNGLSTGVSLAAAGATAGPGMVVNLNANYAYQSGQTVADTIKLMNMLAR